MQILAAGDRAVTVDFGNVINEETNAQVTALANTLGNTGEAGIQELIPTYRSLLVRYDPAFVTREALIRMILEAMEQKEKKAEASVRKVHLIPCCYGGSFGEDLDGMTEVTKRSPRDIVRLHADRDYLIYMMGFLPGFVYLGGLDPRIAAPRLQTPRVEIPAGSVGIGGSQTGIYPCASPGGWRLIGKTPLALFDPRREEPMLCQAGDYIRFVPIREDEYYLIEKDIADGTYSPEVITARNTDSVLKEAGI